MTIGFSFTTPWDAVVLTDCRLSMSPSLKRPPEVVRDICQKLVAPTNWSIVTFAGDLCLGRSLLNAVSNHIQDTSFEESSWLSDDDYIRSFVQRMIYLHVRDRSNHRRCRNSPVRLMISRLRPDKKVPAWVSPGVEGEVPQVETIRISSPGVTIQRTSDGMSIIGSGESLQSQFGEEERNVLLNFGQGNPDRLAHRTMMAAEMVRTLLSDTPEPTIGGLYQTAFLDFSGVSLVPYFYWTSVDQNYGTYVAMRIENGEWVQHHRPTRTRVRVISPFSIHLKGPKWKPGKNEMFEPSLTLTKDSPGVIAKPDVVPLYSIYDPRNVHDAVRASWGSAPIPKLSWAPDKNA